MNWLWFTGIGGLLLFGFGMFLSLKYGDWPTKCQEVKLWVCVMGGEVLFWGSITTAIVLGIIHRA